MKIILLTIPVIILLNLASCATLVNRKIQVLSIIPDDSVNIVYVKQGINLLPPSYDHYISLRSSEPIEIYYTKVNDTQIKMISKYPFRSNAYWWNLSVYAVGMAVDEFSDKKFAYPPKMYLTNDDQLVIEKKGKIRINLSSEYSVYWKNAVSEKYVFWSPPFNNIGIGCEYHYKHNTFITGGLNIGRYIGWTNNSTRITDGSSLVLNLKHGHVVNNFEFSYGLSLIQSTRVGSLGVNAGITNMLTRVTGIQLAYEPHFFDTKNSRLSYMSAIKIGVVFKINANP
jgi:hypothetical protein